MKTYVILTEEQLAKLNKWIANLTEDNFGDRVNSSVIETSKDGSKTFRKEFCAFVDYTEYKLYRIDEEVGYFLVAVINSKVIQDYRYDPHLDIVQELTEPDYDEYGSPVFHLIPDSKSLQRFLDNNV